MSSSTRFVRPFALLLALGLLVALIIPAGMRSSHADQRQQDLHRRERTLALAPGHQITITCPTNLSGVVQGQQVTIECAASPSSGGPAVTGFNGVQDGQTIGGNVVIEALVS